MDEKEGHNTVLFLITKVLDFDQKLCMIKEKKAQRKKKREKRRETERDGRDKIFEVESDRSESQPAKEQ